jgi:hypothetical protein
MTQIYDVSDVIISDNKITLYNFSRSKFLNIFNLVRSFDIFESIYNHSLRADFYIVDGIELLNYFPIAGEEYIEISFQTPNKKILTYEFLVESVIAQKSNDQSNAKLYVLRCVTKDYLTNSYTFYSKRYTNLNYDEAINNILREDLKTSKNIVVETTKGKFDYVVNGIRPFQVIDLICERAVSAKYKSSLFYFYEDNEGYQFTTLEKLIKERKPGAINKHYFYPTSNRASPYEKVINFRNILSYETMMQGSSIEKIKSGSLRNEVREFDILTGDYYSKFEYNNPSDHLNFEKTDNSEDMNSSLFNQTVTQMPATRKMVVKDGLRPNMEHNENLHFKRAFGDRILQYGLRLRVYGDTDIRVGDVIKVSIPDISGITVEPEQQKIYSENFIITEMKHRLDQKENKNFEHYMILEVRKPNMYSSIG